MKDGAYPILLLSIVMAIATITYYHVRKTEKLVTKIVEKMEVAK